ncbi:MAG: hypothetical protein ACK4MS_06680 [Paracoccaceae bacterium]
MKAITDIERQFAPSELVSFGREIAASRHPARDTLLQRDVFAEVLSAKHVQPFQRIPVSPDVSFYSDGGPAKDKTIVIGFGGMGGRLGLPIGSILQVLDAARVDFVLLSDPMQRSFSFGVGDLAPDFTALVAMIRARFRPETYRRVVTIGNSMGATPALRAGFWLDAERAIGVGTRRPNDALMLILRRNVGSAFDPFCDCLRDRTFRGLLVHGGDCVPDVRAASLLEATGAGRRVIFSGMADHNLIWRFWSMGELRAFFDVLLNFQPMPDRNRLAPPIVFGRTWPPRLRAALRRRAARLLRWAKR